MSSPCALWHRNIPELEPVALLRPPHPALDTIMQPWSRKIRRWVVVHKIISWWLIPAAVSRFKFHTFVSQLFVEYHLPNFSSKTPNAWKSNLVPKIQRFLCHFAVSFFFIAVVLHSSKFSFPQDRCGRLTITLVLSTSLWSLRQDLDHSISRKQSGWIVNGVSPSRLMTVGDWDPTMNPIEGSWTNKPSTSHNRLLFLYQTI